MQNRLPFVAAAFICEKVLDEKDGVLTAVRIVDTYTIKAIEIPTAGSSAKGAARNETPVAVEGPKVIDVNALIGVKSGNVTGEHDVTIVARDPDGKKAPMPEGRRVALNGGEHGANFVVRFLMPGNAKPGLYWFDVLWDGELLTSIPLRLKREEPTSQEPEKTVTRPNALAR
jgi:hypothetical protein